eukprot:1670983-Rhodomonas_salina.2
MMTPRETGGRCSPVDPSKTSEPRPCDGGRRSCSPFSARDAALRGGRWGTPLGHPEAPGKRGQPSRMALSEGLHEEKCEKANVKMNKGKSSGKIAARRHTLLLNGSVRDEFELD